MSVFKSYDVRGIYPKELNEKLVFLIGYYFCKYNNLNEIKISHDCRESYENLCKYLILGCIEANTKVDYLGISSTPNFYFSLFNGVNSGIQITASHNDREYNGLKFILNLESFDSRNGLEVIEKLVREDKDEIGEKFNEETINKSLIGLIEDKNILYNSNLEKYVDFLVEKFYFILTKEEIEILKTQEFGCDFSSGVSSLALSQFLQKTNLNYILYNNVCDGKFPVHSPDPMAAKEFISNLEGRCDFYLVFDGDGDRVVFYDENKEVILQDYTICKYIDYFSEQNEKKFVCDLRVSKYIDIIVDKKNVDVEKIRVGRAFYQDFMRKNDIIFGAELSGHMFFREFNYLDNPDFAFIYMLKIFAKELLKNKTIKFSEIFEKYMRFYKREEIKFKVENDIDVFELFIEEFGAKKVESKIDGLSFNLDDVWFNIRPSNTEPVVKLNIEGKNEELVEEVLNRIEGILK